MFWESDMATRRSADEIRGKIGHVTEARKAIAEGPPYKIVFTTEFVTPEVAEMLLSGNPDNPDA